MTKEILPTTNKKFIQSIKKSLNVTKNLDKQLSKTTKRLNNFIKSLSKSNKLSQPFVDMKKQIVALNQAIVSNDLAGFRSALEDVGINFSELSIQSQQMIRSLNQVNKSYGLLAQVFHGSLTIDDTSLISLDTQTKTLIQSFSNVQVTLAGLKNELAIDSSSITTLIDSGKKLAAEFSVMNQNMTAFTGNFSNSQSVVTSFGGSVNSTLASIDASIANLVSISENLGNALSNAIKEPVTEVEKSQNSFQKLKDSLKDLFSPLEKGASAGATFDDLKGRVNKLDEALANVGLPSFQTSILNVGGAFQSVTSQSGSMFQKMNNSIKKTGENYSLMKKVFKGKLEVGDDAFKKLDEGTQNTVKHFAKMEQKLSNVSQNVTQGIGKMKQSLKQSLGDVGVSGLAKILPAQMLDPSITGELDPTAGVRVLLKSGLSDIKQDLEGFGTIGSRLFKLVQGSMKIGTTALSGMIQGLVSVIGIAMKAIAPTAIIGLALAGLGLLDSQMDGQLSNMVKTAITKGPEVIPGFVQGIIEKIPDLIASGAQLIAGLAEAISVNLPIIMQSALDIINTLIQGVIDNLPTLIPAALMLIESLSTSLLSAAPQLLLTGLNLLLALVDGILANKNQIVETVTNIIEAFTTNITNLLPQIVQKGVEILVKLAEGIASVLPQLIPVAIEAITTLVRTLSENLPTILNAAVEIIGKLCEGLINNLPQILSAAWELIDALASGLLKALPEILKTGAKIVLGLIGELGKHAPELMDAGKNLIQGLIDGISEKAKVVIDTVKNIAKGIGDKFKSIFNIHSPSRWMRDEIGAMLPAGLAIGIERNAHIVDQPMDTLASKIVLPSLDSLDQQVDSVQKMSIQSSSIQIQQKEKQPAKFNIRLGNQQFKAFVEDISEAMGQDSAINLAF